jgi:ATP-binding cassette subfamily B protein
VVKSFAVEPARERAFARSNGRYLDESMALTRARSAMTPMLAMGGGLATLIVLWIGGRAVIAARPGGPTLPELVEFNALLALLAWPTLALGFILAVVQRGRASWSRLAELLSERPAIADAEGARRPDSAIAPTVETRNLTVEIGGRTLIDRVSLTVPAGALVALVGRTGAGKSTVAETLPRLLEIAPGQVLLGGHEATSLPIASVRGAVGYAPQEAFLFSASIARNIALGLPGPLLDPEAAAENPRVRAAAEAAGLARDLAILPDGLRTVVGERGITLSGGQRQRVALARALAGDPQILVLDDSLSSVDAETERDILRSLKELRAGRTTLIISHRVAAVRDAHEIVVLDQGRVAERGTHEQLLAGAGIYAGLYRAQLIEAEIAAHEVTA